MPKPNHPNHPHQQPNPRPHPRPHNPKGVPFAARLVDANGNVSLAIDGSAAPVEYRFVPADDLTVTEFSFMFEDSGEVAYGDRFLTLNNVLTNGLTVFLQSYGVDVAAQFKASRDLVEYCSPGGFYVDKGGGTTIIKATRQFTQGLQLKDRTNDFVKLIVQDDLSGFSYAAATLLGYTA